MLRGAVSWTLTACLYAAAGAQPPSCQTNEHCPDGFYCEQDVAFICRSCLNCEQLKRNPPSIPSSCIKSASECGACVAGLVEDFRDDLECVEAVVHSSDSAIPAYVWVVIALGLLLFVAVVVVVVYVILRNTYTFKILASTRASVQSPCHARAGAASAPESPPPYEQYSALRPSSPPPDEESAWPFIKRSPSVHGGRGPGAREAAGNQAALVYNNPSYVRGPQLPTSYDSAGGVGQSANSTAMSVISDDERDALAHDEDTMESTWTPTPSNSSNTNAAGALATQLEAARGSALVRAPHAHPPCGWQDTNNNRNGSEPVGDGSSAPALVINVVQTINTLQQAPPHKHDAC